ncbi:hypothetical protein D3C84_659600 [compost metagenome]
MGCQRPPVILAAFDDVQLVAAPGTVFVFPQGAGPWIERSTLRVAHTVGPDFGAHTGLTDKWVVVRYFTVGIDTNDLALKFVEVLCGRAVVVFPEGDEQITVTVKDQPRTKMVANGELWFLTENHREILEVRQVLGQPPATDSRAGLVTLTAPLGVGQVNQAVLLEVR